MALSALTDNVANSLGMNGPCGGGEEGTGNVRGSETIESVTASVRPPLSHRSSGLCRRTSSSITPIPRN